LNKLPVIFGRDLVRILAKVGFQFDRQKGSHMILFRAEPPTTLTVPDHRELDRGTLRAILRQAGITPEELETLIRGELDRDGPTPQNIPPTGCQPAGPHSRKVAA